MSIIRICTEKKYCLPIYVEYHNFPFLLRIFRSKFSSLKTKPFIFVLLIVSFICQGCKWCTPWRSTRLLPLCYFLSKYHTVFRHKKRFHLVSDKYGNPCAYFHENHTYRHYVKVAFTGCITNRKQVWKIWIEIHLGRN